MFEPNDQSPFERRYWNNVDSSQDTDATGCWRWTGDTDTKGYGTIKLRNVPLKAHRIAYEFLHGPIPEGYDVHHRCGNKWCVNGEHLEALPHAEHASLQKGKRKPRKATHCKRGHEFTEDNTYVWKNMRRCRACMAINKREERARRADAS